MQEIFIVLLLVGDTEQSTPVTKNSFEERITGTHRKKAQGCRGGGGGGGDGGGGSGDTFKFLRISGHLQ